MWDDFSDIELIYLAMQYGIEDELVQFQGRLFNREEVESRLTEIEHDSANA